MDRSDWLRLFVLLFASVAAPLNQFKVPPVLPLLMKAFTLPATKAGLLMSLFAVTGIFLAFPAGLISHRLGYRTSGLIAIAAVSLGSAIGAVSRSAGLLLASRMIEGVGLSLMTVAAPALIAIYFTADKRGMPMGVWATWVPLGSTLMFAAAPLLAARWSWQGVWWFGCVFAVIAGFCFGAVIRPRSTPSIGAYPSPASGLPGSPSLKTVLRNRDLWLISLLFGCFNFVFIAFVSWVPMFLNATEGVSLTRASFMISILTIATMVALPVSGRISDKLNSRKAVCVPAMLIITILAPAIAFISPDGILPLMVALGLTAGFIPSGVFAAGTETVENERLAGMAMAVILVGQNAGMLLGPFIFGWIIETTGSWRFAFATFVPVGAVGAIAGWMSKVR